MPVVPATPGPRVQLGVTPGVRIDVPDLNAPDVRLTAPQISAPMLRNQQLDAPRMTPALGNPAAIGRVELSDRGAGQMAQAGRMLEGASDVIMRAAQDMQMKVNATVVDDALNQAREAARKLTWGEQDGQGGMTGGYRNAKGYDAIKRPSGKPLDDEVVEAFERQVSDIAKNRIANPAQRRAFEQQVATVAAQLRQGAAVWQAEQFDQYHAGVYKGMVVNLTEDFARLDPGDMASQRETIGMIEGAVATSAAHSGASAQELDVGQRAARGAAVGSLFDRVLAEGKYDTAQALLNEWGEVIDANSATRMKLALDGKVGIVLGEQLAADAWKQWAAPAYEAQDPDRAFNIMLGLESGESQTDAKGNTIQGPMTRFGVKAFGIAQLMPDTAEEVAKKLGRPELAELAQQPTREGEAANRLLGRTYFNQMVTQFRGDTAKAMAAYNAGPGRVQDAIKRAAQDGGTWMDYVPEETQNYVRKGMQAFGAGDGKPAKPSRAQLLEQIDARTTDPDVRRAAYSWVDRRFAAADYDEREQQETAYARGLTIVRETGGNLNAIPPELKSQIKPDQFTTLQTYAKNMADGSYQATKPEAYYVAMNPANLKSMTVNQLEAMRPDLSEQDFNAVRQAWVDARSPQPGKGPDSLDVSTLDGILDTRLQYMGIDIAPKKGDTAAIARLGAIRQFMHQHVLEIQRQQGVKFTDYAQLQDVVNKAFTRSQTFTNRILGVDVSSETQTVLTAKVGDIPSETRNRISAELERQLRRKPTDAELLQAYFRSQFYTGASNGR